MTIQACCTTPETVCHSLPLQLTYRARIVLRRHSEFTYAPMRYSHGISACEGTQSERRSMESFSWSGKLVRVCRAATAALVILLVPAVVWAQATITGTVKDTSGALLPGVTGAASSTALIKKFRAAVSDGTGQYRIENLRPGMYTVKFVLTGFSTVVRQGVEVSGSATVSINADMRVG